MTWKILNRKKNQFTQIESGSIISLGNFEACDIYFQSNERKKLFVQIIIDEHFIYIVDEIKVIISFQSLSYFQEGIVFEFVLEDKKTDGFNKLPNYDEVQEIYSSQEFIEYLFLVQDYFSKNKYVDQEDYKVSPVEVIEVCCLLLAPLFWVKRDIFQKEQRRIFELYLWCIWSQMAEFGILTLALNDPEISEIMVNHHEKIYFEKNGVLSLSQLKFLEERTLIALIERICVSAGRRIDESIPYCDARLNDGSRIHAILPPLALSGPCLTIRKFPRNQLTPEKMIEIGSISQSNLNFLQKIVKERKNILISGGTGSGKTTLLNCLSSFIPEEERIITLEDSAELKLQQEHVVRLESRLDNIENKGKVSLRDLLKNTLRMRPDRIIMGECRGGEALDMLQAMNTGHDGSMTTIHSNSPRDALRRLETLVLFAELSLPSRAIREQIASGIHYVIQQTRLSSGKRCVTEIHEVIGLCDDSGQFITKSVFSLSEAKL